MDKKVLLACECVSGLRAAWEHHGYAVVQAKEDIMRVERAKLDAYLERACKDGVSAVFSFDFSPSLAEGCHARDICYVSWVWDCPHLSLWAKSARFRTNRIFLFDYAQYEKQMARGLTNVWYLPLAADVEAFEETIAADKERSEKKYGAEVAFLGNIYNDEEQGLYDRIKYLPSYVRGYLEALMQVQRKVWGVDLLEDGVSDAVWAELKRYVKWDLGDRYEDGVYEMQMKDILGKKIAQLERMEVCSYLARHFDFALYTGADTSFDAAIKSRGYAAYLTEMPLVFRYSKINIHITIRSITSGVPLRVVDVLACGGFLLTNYQPEIAEYFEDGKELVIYQDFEDMYEKIAYYLAHEEEREQIAHAGYLKVKERFSYRRQVGEIIQVLEEKNE